MSVRRPGDSPHFSYREFAPAGARGLDARSRRAVDELVRNWLHPLREQFGRCTVHSGERTPERNRAVGGAPQSFHVYSRRRSVAAADVSFERGTPQQWADTAARLDPRGGIGVYPGHVHIDSRGTAARW